MTSIDIGNVRLTEDDMRIAYGGRKRGHAAPVIPGSYPSASVDGFGKRRNCTSQNSDFDDRSRRISGSLSPVFGKTP